MDDYVFSAVCFLTALSFIFGGTFLLKKPPKNINPIYGYRTKLSMKSQSNWDLAQPLGGINMRTSGIYLLVAALFGLLNHFLHAPLWIQVLLALLLLLFSVIHIVKKTDKTILEREEN